MRDLSGKEDTSELMAVVEMRQALPEHVRLSENPFLVAFVPIVRFLLGVSNVSVPLDTL